MPRKNYSTEQIISKLREAEVLLGQGKTVGEACRVLTVSEQTYTIIPFTNPKGKRPTALVSRF